MNALPSHVADRSSDPGHARVNIVMLVSGFPRRSETFALNELLALERAGCLAAVFATKPGDAGPAHPAARGMLEKVQLLAPGSPEEQAAEVVSRIDGRPVTGVHGYFAHVPAEVAQHAARRLGVPFGFSVHAADARKVLPDELRRRARAAACVVACNGDVASDLQRTGADVELVPHGVDLERFSASPAPGGEVLRVLAVGRLVDKKGFPVLVEAAARLAIPFEIRIVGTGPCHVELTEQIAAADLGARVRLVGPRTHAELPAEFASAHVLVAPSIVDRRGDRDGVPNVLLEAMASGRPVVASAVGAVGSAVDDGRTGILVPPGDPGRLAEALEELARRPDLRERMGRAGRARVERRFDLASCTGRLERYLRVVYG
jgi:glycosyltransferase involved in cell wall biosynthesis